MTRGVSVSEMFTLRQENELHYALLSAWENDLDERG